MKPTYEQLEIELAETKKLLKLALEKIAELEERLYPSWFKNRVWASVKAPEIKRSQVGQY